MSSKNPFTCITCRVAFATSELQRDHYKTDWHRYNLKRKVAELPAVTAEAFNEKVAEKQKLQPQKKEEYCAICRKKYKSENAFKSHLQTRLHRQLLEASEKQDTESSEKDTTGSEKSTSENLERQVAVASENTLPSVEPIKETTSDKPCAVEDMDDESSDAESWCSEDGLGLEECLFCSHISEDSATSLQHMAAKHSFFLPHAEYISDMDGLLAYLGQKVGCGHMCLWCADRSKTFRSTRATQQHMRDMGHCMVRYEEDSLFEFSDFYDYSASYPEAESEESRMDIDTELDTSGFELALPSGTSVGHRSLRHFYRQNLPLARRKRTNVSRVLQQYKAIGWTGTAGEQARKAAKDLASAKRFRSQQQLRLKVKANKLQHHFRCQNPI